ncbi:MAG: excinuclease ABC subunit UvrA, partial [Coriobacteriia bacterium]|nr:excinuclease ABC subunit UvrA [Coriobacteriia bacterium]
MGQDQIVIRGARQHNLANVDVTIPRDKLVVITGLSGSGKSSLAFDTIYAEGQRRYVESLSSYARQFLGQMDKPDVDSIDGLSPAVSIDQKTTSKNPRSTVGTVTEIYDYLRLLYARIGVPHCPECGRVIEKQTTDQVSDKILELGEGRRAYILSPVIRGKKGEHVKLLESLKKEGYTRVFLDGEVRELEEEITLNKNYKHDIDVVVDRVVIKSSARTRIAEAVENATTLSDGRVRVFLPAKDEIPDQFEDYSLALACPIHGHSIDELEPRDFSFNAPYGACPVCDGLGYLSVIDGEAMLEDPSKPVNDGAFGKLFGNSNYYPQIFTAVLKDLGVDPQTAWQDLSEDVREAILNGTGDKKIRVDYLTKDGRNTHWFIKFSGVRNIIHEKYKESSNENVRKRLEEYIRDEPCPSCHGARLKPEYLAVTVGDLNIFDLTSLSTKHELEFFQTLQLSERERYIGERIVREILERLKFLVDVGLDYLTLNRTSGTLSGGEAQRIRLATQIGAGLVGVLYVLDEPSIGLHQRDNERLIHTLEHLRDLGNSVLVVEHDEDTIRAADYVIDMGPRAGELGGKVVAHGSPEELVKSKESLTAQYLNGMKKIALPKERRSPQKGSLKLFGAKANNLKNIDIEIELGTFTVVTGVSGSGKSSLITDTLAPALTNRIHNSKKVVGKHQKIEGIDLIDKVIDIDQSPIGRTPRSNPATYISLWDDIRALFA